MLTNFGSAAHFGAHGRRGVVATAVAVIATMTLGLWIGAPASHAAELSAATLGMSNNQAGANNVVYTAQFTTATAAVIKRVSFEHSTVQGSLGLGTVFGLGAGVASYAGGAVSYTVTSPVLVSAATRVYVEFTGLSNGVGSQLVSLTTWDGAATPTVIDTVANIPLVTGGVDTAVTVEVGRSLAFTSDTQSYTMLMDPSLAALSDLSRTVTLTVKTNMGQGYGVSMKNIGLKTGGSGGQVHRIEAAANSTVSEFAGTRNRFGVNATARTTNSRAAINAPFAGANISGYSTAGANVLSASKPTGNSADTIELVNRVTIDYSTPAGTYTDTITYTAVPAY